MLPSLLTACFFACSAVFGSQSSRLLGAAQANLMRLSLAALILAVYAFSFGQGFSGPGFPVYLLSGLIGFGLGDVALFLAFERLGAQRSILLAQCLAVFFAALTEWIWLGTMISIQQFFLVLLILVGVFTAMYSPAQGSLLKATRGMGVGIVLGMLAALGQAWGAVLSRKAVLLNNWAEVELSGATASFQRILAGLVVAGFFYLWSKRRSSATEIVPFYARPAAFQVRAWRLCLLNGLMGPVLGVSCYQWALSDAPSGIVLAIVATTPILVIPLAWLWEGERPTVYSCLGSFLAIAGVLGLLFS
jgi:drug/metabolite transporter (DMT)-like permease